MRNKKLRTRMLAIMLVLVMLISVGYAALTTTLQVVGNASIKKNTWSIYFDNVVINPANSVASVVTNPTTSGTTTTVLNWEVNMDTPGQVYEFNVDIVNEGSIDAMIGSLSNTALTTNQAKYLDYTIKYENGALVEAKDKLASGERKTITVRLAFKTDVNPSDLPQQGETGITLTFNIPDYKQADNTAVEKQTAVQYAVTFKDYDGTDLKTVQVNKGATASYGETNPTRAADASYTYEFSKWVTTQGGETEATLTNITEAKTVYASYTATEIPEPPAIGTAVNYSTTLNNVTLDNWKVFYNENGYTYLIYGGYLLNSAVPAFTGKQTRDKYNVYTNTNRADLINGLSNKESYDSLLTGTLTVNGETKQIAETRTANVWAMGAPTLDLFVNSWNETQSTQLYTNTRNNMTDIIGWGYYIGIDNASTTSNYVSGLDSSQRLYFPYGSGSYDCSGYWLASPSANDAYNEYRVMSVIYYGAVGSSTFSNDGPTGFGARPVVCLPSNILQ